MIIKTEIKYLRISPKKIKTLSFILKGLTVQKSIEKLTFQNNKSARLLTKVIKSAISNATNNLKLKAENLYVKSIEIGKGPFFKRWQPVSRGMAHQIKKRTTHVKLILEEIKQVTPDTKVKRQEIKIINNDQKDKK